MELYISIAIISMIVGWMLTLIDNGDRNFPYGLIGGILGLIVPFILLICMTETTPTALDVYKGKTTLEITYKESIPIDTVVVFKDKER